MKQNPIHDQPDAAGFFEMNWRPILVAWAIGLPGVAAVAVSAHLPAASALVGELSAPVVLHVLLANTAFGLIAGYLYWRHGLESAMVAHASVHLASFVLGSG